MWGFLQDNTHYWSNIFILSIHRFLFPGKYHHKLYLLNIRWHRQHMGHSVTGICHFLVVTAPPRPIWPSGKLPFDCKKISKNLTFKKNCQKCSFFLKLHFFERKENFRQFFWKNVKFCEFFYSQMAIFRMVRWTPCPVP